MPTRPPLTELLGIRQPILLAPMAGVTTPALAAAVSAAGGLGALGLGASDPAAATRALAEAVATTGGAVNANFFCHAPPQRDSRREAAWLDRMAPLFARFDARPPARLEAIYPSFCDSDAFLALLLELRPRVASFHFGLPRPEQIAALRAAGLVLIASATSLDEARRIEAAGFDAVVAQGWEAGGHRGIFDPAAPDARLPTEALLGRIRSGCALPVIAAGGIMDGSDIARLLDAGAAAVQIGTAFIGCPESAADTAYRDRLALGGETVMTAAISGRPARCLANGFTEWAEGIAAGDIPAYPCCYDAGKALNAAARAQGATAYGAQWAGAGAGRARSLPASELMAELVSELAAACR